MSTPHVSGVAALLFSFKPSASPDEVYNAMACSAVDVGSPGYDTTFGYGIVDAVGALTVLNSSNPCVPVKPLTSVGISSIMYGSDRGSSCVVINAEIKTDENGYQDSYFLVSSGGVVIWLKQNLASNTTYEEHSCVDPTECYQFQISDSGGDGITGGGVTLTYNGTQYFEGGNFGYGGWINVGDGC